MRFSNDVIAPYVAVAPAALAFERSLECRLYPTVPFEHPVLDLGCGEGLLARVLFQEQIDTGIDPNPRELERARQLGAYCELIECYGDRIPKPDGSYRTVFSNSVLEHIPDVEPVFAEVFRILAPNGRFHFTAPSPRFERFTWTGMTLRGLGLNALDTRWRALFNRFWAHHHAYELTKWEQLAMQAGFEVVESRSFAPARVCLLNSALVPFGLPAKITKLLTNRWVLLPRVRKLLTMPLCTVARVLLRGGEDPTDGGLVFLSLRKPA
jgi:SAM-dependent methyltransferase